MRKQDNYTFLTTAPVGRVIPTMAVPTVISMLVTSIYNLVDTYFVGLINTQATAAVGVAFPMMAIIQSLGFLFGQGSGTYMARHLGARRLDEASQMAATSFIASIICGLVVTVLGLIFLKPLSILLGSTPTILPYTMQFMGVILLGAPLMTASMVINNQMRFQGNPTQAMYGMISGAVLNVLLVPLFMFPDAGYGGRFIRWVLGDSREPINSFGNGSAMRVSAAGWLGDTLEETLRLAKLSAEVTHNHPEGIKGAQATAAAMFMARNGKTKEEIKDFIESKFGYDLNKTMDDIVSKGHGEEICQVTVPQALVCFLLSDSYIDCIRKSVSIGGDSDTIACIAGGIAEAFYGMEEDYKRVVDSKLDEYLRAIVLLFLEKCSYYELD